VRADTETERATALSVLTGGLTRENTTRLAATVAAERDAERSASMSTLVGILDAETRQAVHNRLERHLDDLTVDGLLSEEIRGRLAADDGTRYLARLLRAVEQSGEDPRAVLTDAVTSGKPLDDAESPARVLSYRITQTHDIGHPVPGTELPADITQQEHAQLAELHDRAQDRACVLGARTAEQAPEWAVQALGPVPPAEDAADRADWEHRAGQVAAHREAVGWTHPEQALGQMPGVTTTERRTSYTAAWHALGQPEGRLTEADMSEGQLRARIRARDNADAWAPPNVAPALRDAEHKAEQARQAAAFAAAEGRHDDAERLRAQAAEAAATVHRLTEADDARTAWYTTTLETRTTGDAAQAEADRRGINLHDQPDRVTAEEWLALEAQARLDDDHHRPISETDLDLADPDLTMHADWHVPDPRSPELATHHTAAPAAQVDEVDEHGQGVIPGLHPDAKRPRNHAYTTLGPSITAQQLEALAATTALTAALTADHLSQDTTHAEHEQEERAIDAWDAGRRRREAAELDHAVTTGTDLGAEAVHDAGTEYGPRAWPGAG
jgi:hypothetical protein